MRSNYAALPILLSILIIFGVTQKSHAAKEFIPFSYYDEEVCLLGKDSVTCVTSDLVRRNLEFTRPLKNPYIITSNAIQTCIVDDQGLSCVNKKSYNNYGLSIPQPPSISNKIKQLVSDSFTTCALSDEDNSSNTQIHCWGHDISIPYDIGFIESISLNDQKELCALSNWGVFCRSRSGDTSLNTKQIKLDFKATKIYASNGVTCALNKVDIKCWGIFFYGEQAKTPTFYQLSGLSLGYRYSCAIDSEKIKCWGTDLGTQLQAPAMKNPRYLLSSGLFTCASNYHEVMCWGHSGGFRAPLEDTLIALNFSDEGIHESLERMALLSNPIKNRFFNELSTFSKSHLNIDTKKSAAEQMQVQYGTYLLLSLIKPAVLSGDSEHYLTNVIPALQNSLQSRGKSLSIENVNAIPFQSDLLKLTALKVIQSSILLGKDFLSLQDQKQLSNVLKALGQSIATPTQMNITTLLNEMNNQKVFFDKLNQSPKTAFLYDTISMASLYLEKQVR